MRGDNTNHRLRWALRWGLVVCAVIVAGAAMGMAAAATGAGSAAAADGDLTTDSDGVAGGSATTAQGEIPMAAASVNASTNSEWITWERYPSDEVAEDETIRLEVTGYASGNDVCIRKEGRYRSLACVEESGSFERTFWMDADELGLSPGESADFYGAIRSWGTTNAATGSWTVTYPDADAEVTDIYLSPDELSHGEDVVIQPAIENTGGPTETFYYEAEVSGGGDSYTVGDGTIEIEPGFTEYPALTWEVDDDADIDDYDVEVEVYTATSIGTADDWVDTSTYFNEFSVCGPELEVGTTHVDVGEFEYGNPPMETVSISNAGCGDLEWEVVNAAGLQYDAGSSSVELGPTDLAAGEFEHTASIYVMNEHYEGAGHIDITVEGFAYAEATAPEVSGVNPTGSEMTVGGEILFGGTADAGSDGIPSDEYPAASVDELEFIWEKDGEVIRSGSPDPRSGVDDAFEHEFTEAGSYDISLTVEDPYSGKSDTLYESGYDVSPATVSGQVTHDTFGDGVEADIYVDGSRVGSTDGDGHYEISLSEAGERSLRFEAVRPGYETVETTVNIDGQDVTEDVAIEAEPKDVTVVVTREDSIDGYEPIGDEEIEGATVEIDGDTYTTDEDGRVELSLDAGVYEYTVDAEDYETLTDEVEIRTGYGSHIIPVGLVTEGVGVLEVDIVDDAGDSISPIYYDLYADGEELEPDAQGQVLLEADTYELQVVPDDRDDLEEVSETITIEEGKLTPVELSPDLDVDASVSAFETPGGEFDDTDRLEIEFTIANTGETTEEFYYELAVGPTSESETYLEADEAVSIDPGSAETRLYTPDVGDDWADGEYEVTLDIYESSAGDTLVDARQADGFLIETEPVDSEVTIDEFDIAAHDSQHDNRGVGRTENYNRSYASQANGEITTQVGARAGPVGATSGSRGTGMVGASWQAQHSEEVEVVADSTVSGNISVVPDDKPWYLPDVTDGYGARGAAETSVVVYDETEGEIVATNEAELVDYRVPSWGELAVSQAFTIANTLTAGVGGTIKEQLADQKASAVTEASIEFAGDTITEETIGEGASLFFDSSYDEPIDQRNQVSVAFDAEEGHDYRIYKRADTGVTSIGLADRAAAAEVDLTVDLHEIHIQDASVEEPTVTVESEPSDYVDSASDAETAVSAASADAEGDAELEFRVRTPDGTTTDWQRTSNSYLEVHPGDIVDDVTEGEYVMQFRAADTRSDRVSTTTAVSTTVVETDPSVSLTVTDENADGATLYASVESVTTIEEVVFEHRVDGEWRHWQTATPGEELRYEQAGETDLRAQAIDDRGVAGEWARTTVTVPDDDTSAPEADAGENQTVDAGSLVTLDASDSTHPDGDTLAFEWSQVTGPTVSLDDADTTSFQAPDVEVASTLQFAVTVTDEAGTSDSAIVEVVVEPDEEADVGALFAIEAIHDPDTVTVGDTAERGFVVENIGDESGSVTIDSTLTHDGSEQGTTDETVTVAAGDTETVTSTVEYEAADVGTWSLEVCEDGTCDTVSWDVIEERDKPYLEGPVDTADLRMAIDDWRRGEVDTQTLRQVIDAWRTGGPVE